MLRGHGLRDRQQFGPRVPLAPPVIAIARVRRYRCRRCAAVTTVVPRGVVRRRLFSAAAIGYALALFGVSRLSAREVRQRTSPWHAVGDAAHAGWAQLRRWARAVRSRRLFGCVRPCPARFSLREVAARAATTLAALDRAAPAGVAIEAAAFAGAAHAA